MKKTLLTLILLACSLFASDMDKISDSELSYFFDRENRICTPSTIFLAEYGMDSIQKIRSNFSDAKISTDVRKELGYIELKSEDKYYIFYKGLKSCINNRFSQVVSNLPLVKNGKELMKSISPEYFNYYWVASGECLPSKDNEGMKKYLLKEKGHLFQLDEKKGIVNVWSGGNNLFAKTIDECLKL